MVNPTVNHSVNVTDMYMSVLASLSVSDRLDLISKLSASIKKDSKENTATSDLMTMFCGDWRDVAELRNDKYFGREITKW